MRHTNFPFRARHKAAGAAASLALLAAAFCVAASTRPQYGGTLRVEMRERVTRIDPRQWPSDSEQAAATERIAVLVFDRLVRFDDHGAVVPALAMAWQSDAENKRWQFRLRQGVTFSDGTPLTPEAAALALQQLLGNAFDVSATGDSVVVQSDRAMPNLPAQIAAGRFFIFHASDDRSIYGTGPFAISQWPEPASASGTASANKAILTANPSCWAGRPFVDQIEIAMGATEQQQANAVAFGDADVVELFAAQLRAAVQRGVRTAGSDPVDLYALEFDLNQPSAQDARFREAVSSALDRSSLADVILQRQGVAAGGLLPNWLSGYSFLFPAARDLPRARDLLSAARREDSRPLAIELNYDFSDSTIPDAEDEARAIVERVAINLREAGIMVQLPGKNGERAGRAAGSRDGISSAQPPMQVRLVRRHIDGPNAQVAMDELLESLGQPAAPLATAQDTYNAERDMVSSFYVIPLVYVSETYGLGPRVRDWLAPRWGGWRLDDVWLAQPQPQATNTRSAEP